MSFIPMPVWPSNRREQVCIAINGRCPYFLFSGLDNSLPFDGLKFYGEMGAEDSSGNGWPKEHAALTGLFVEDPFSINNTNLRIEWASTAINRKHDAWYTHSVYWSGYRYKDHIIGHHMGTDADDLFARFEYHTTAGSGIGVETDIERRGVHSASTNTRNWFGLDLTRPLYETLNVSIGCGFENGDETSSEIWSKLEWDL